MRSELQTFADLFCGIGGFRLALKRRGLRCVFSSEIDEHAAEAYFGNFGERPAGDIREVPAEEIPDHDVLCAGFPCQSFSLAGTKTTGRRGLADPRGALFFEIVRIAKKKRPAVMLLENVRGLLTQDGGRAVAEMDRALDEAGYVVRRNVLNAADYGIPQNRERVYFVCSRKELGWGWKLPAPRPPVLLRDVLMPEDHPEIVSLRLRRDDLVWEAARPKGLLRRVGYLSRYVRKKKLLSHDGAIHSAEGVSPTLVASRGKSKVKISPPDIKEGGRVFSVDGVYPTLLKSGKTKGVDGKIAPEERLGGRIYAEDGVSPSLTASDLFGNRSTVAIRRGPDGKLLQTGQNNAVYSPDGVLSTLGRGNGSTRNRNKIGKPEYGYARSLHQTEKKRIMGFPDDWTVSPGGRGDGQLGNAVIPSMVELLLEGLA